MSRAAVSQLVVSELSIFPAVYDICKCPCHTSRCSCYQHFLSPTIISKSYHLLMSLVQHHTALVFDQDRLTYCPALNCDVPAVHFIEQPGEQSVSAHFFHDPANTGVVAIILVFFSSGLNLSEQWSSTFFLWEVVAHYCASHEGILSDTLSLRYLSTSLLTPAVSRLCQIGSQKERSLLVFIVCPS